jgi:septal ring factor EnvC (AmiA/AmiB activator)
MMAYYRAFSQSRQEKIDTFVQTLKHLSAVESEIELEKRALQKTFSEFQDKRKALSDSQNVRMATLEKLENRLSNNNQKLATLENDRKRLEAILNKVYEEINSQELAIGISEFAQLKGKLPRPTKGKTLNRFGSRRAANGLTWQGIEFQGRPGADIIAVHHGQVVFSDYLRGHGLLIVVDHGAGFMSLYAHAANLYKELGEWVDAGEVIASVGNTGGRRDTALYFELRKNGKATDPSAWFKRA